MKLRLYYANWCGHCRRLKQKGGTQQGAWTTLKAMNKKKRGFSMHEVRDDQMTKKQRSQVGGFPTIHLYDDNNNFVANYMGDRSVKDIKKFVNDHKQQRGGRRRRRKTRKRRRKTRKRRRKTRKRRRKTRRP